MAGPTDPPDWVKANSGKVQSAFDRAHADKQKAEKPQATNSQQVSNTAPGMNGPNPPKNAKNVIAEQSHNKDMQKDDQRVKDAMEKMKAVKARQQKAPEKGKDKGEPER